MAWHSKLLLQKGTRSDCKQADNLACKIKAKYLVAKRRYDVVYIIDDNIASRTNPIIPSKKNKEITTVILYRLHHTFLHIKPWRDISNLDVRENILSKII